MSFLCVLGLIYGVLSAALCGFFAVSVCAKDLDLPFKIIFGTCAGFGIFSILYFILKVFNIENFGVYVFCEIALMGVLGGIFFAKRQEINLKTDGFKISKPFLFAILLGFLIYMKYFIINALGSWDGFRIFGIKARFLYEMSPNWQRVFELPHFMMHNDYPFFVPASFARLWHFCGGAVCDAANIFGIICTFSAVFLIYFALKRFKSRKIAALFASILALCPIFLTNGASQAADIPIAFVNLCAGVCLLLFFENKNISYVILGTFFAGLSAWTKNEGMMFLLVYCAVFCGYFLYKREWKNIFILFASLLPFTALLGFFKHLAHTPNDVILGITTLKTYDHIFEPAKYILIVKTALFMLFTRFSMLFLLLIPACAGLCVKNEQKAPAALLAGIFALMCCGYFLIYLLSPHDLSWHLDNSLDRIMLQMLPFSILLFGLVIRENRTK